MALANVGAAGVLEQLLPRRDVRPAAQQRPALALGHATPDPELNAVVQRIGEALRAYDAAEATSLDAVLRRTLDEEVVRVGVPAGAESGPVTLSGCADQVGSNGGRTAVGRATRAGRGSRRRAR